MGHHSREPQVEAHCCFADPTFMNLQQFLEDGEEALTSLDHHIQRDNLDARQLLSSLNHTSRRAKKVEVQASPVRPNAGAPVVPSTLVVNLTMSVWNPRRSEGPESAQCASLRRRQSEHKHVRNTQVWSALCICLCHVLPSFRRACLSTVNQFNSAS